MGTYLIGILYHEPSTWELFQAGAIEDCESSTGIFVDAALPEEAIAWGERVGEALLRKLNADETLDWKDLGYWCWIEEQPNTSNWKHCLSFFQHIKSGEWPDFDAMGSPGYTKWAEKNGIKYA